MQGVAVNFEYRKEGIYCELAVKSQGKTGLEIEALMACSAAFLRIYDMCKALDKTMEIIGISFLEKTGGRSAYYE